MFALRMRFIDKISLPALVFFALTIFSCQSVSAEGIDPDYGDQGYAKTELEFGVFQYLPRSFLLPDGKSVVAASPIAGGLRNFYVQRLTADGERDTTFNMFGDFITPISGGHDTVEVVQVDSLGRVIVGGYSTSIQGEGDFLFLRLTEDGDYDSSFGNGGVVQIDLLATDTLYDMVVDSSGNIYAVGRAKGSDGFRDIAIKLNSNGTPDPDFGVNGILDINVVGPISMAMAFDVSGHIIVAGEGNQMIRVSPSGDLDTAFAGDGMAEGNISGIPMDIIVDSSGNIYLGSTASTIAGGSATVITSPVVTRFFSDGYLDTSFGSAGSAMLTGKGALRNITLSPNGSPIIAVDLADIQLAAFTTNGAPNNTFGTNGMLSIAASGAILHVSDVATDLLGRIIVSGIYEKTSEPTYLFSARIIETAAPTPGGGGGSGGGGGGSIGLFMLFGPLLILLLKRFRREKVH